MQKGGGVCERQHVLGTRGRETQRTSLRATAAGHSTRAPRRRMACGSSPASGVSKSAAAVSCRCSRVQSTDEASASARITRLKGPWPASCSAAVAVVTTPAVQPLSAASWAVISASSGLSRQRAATEAALVLAASTASTPKPPSTSTRAGGGVLGPAAGAAAAAVSTALAMPAWSTASRGASCRAGSQPGGSTCSASSSRLSVAVTFN